MPSAEDYREIIQNLKQQVQDLQNENMTILSEVDHLKDMQRELADETGYYQKKYTAMDTELTQSRHLTNRLETQLYTQEQDITNLRKENQQLNKSKKELEKKLSGEGQQFENDRIQWQKREADLYNQIRTLSTNGLNPSSPRRRSVSFVPSGPNTMSGLSFLGGISESESPSLASTLTVGNDSNPSSQVDSSYAREAKIASRTIKAQDKLISDLKAEIEKQKTIALENQQQAQRHAMKIEHLENELSNVKRVNRSLMEDNESYQILLHEKTMSGEFMLNPITQNNTFSVDEFDAKENTNGLNLAAELNLASGWEPVQKESETNLMVEKLSEENKGLKDENKALALYINKILLKIMANKQLEEVLSIDVPDDAPPPKSRAKTPAPEPSSEANKSSSFLSKQSRPRRKTISTPMGLWGSRPSVSEDDDKVTNPAATSSSNSTPTTSTSTASKPVRGHTRSPSEVLSTDAKALRRHSSIASGTTLSSPSPTESKSSSLLDRSNSAGSWAKALKRMSGIAWSRNVNEDSPTETTDNTKVESPTETDIDIKVNGGSGAMSPLRRSGDVDVLESLEESEER